MKHENNRERASLRRIVALVMVACLPLWGVAGCVPGEVRYARDWCRNVGWNAECGGTFAGWLRADPEGARVALRDAISRMTAQCTTPLAPPLRRRTERIGGCLVVAVLKTRINLSGGTSRAGSLRFELERLVPASWDSGMALWRELVAASSETWFMEAEVSALREIDALTRGEQAPERASAWVTDEVRLHLAQDALRCAEGGAPSCGEGASREARLFAAQRLSASASSPEARALTLRAHALLAAHLDGALTGELSALEARAPSTAAIEELAAALGAMLPRAREASWATLRPRIMALHARWVEACARETSATGHFVEGIAHIERAQLAGQDDRAATGAVSRLRVEGAARHARLASQRASAGRLGAAWLHGRVARSLSQDGAAPDAEAYVAARRQVPWTLDAQPGGCPWLVVPAGAGGPAAEGAATSATVSVRWEGCASEETRATRDEAYSWSTERRELFSRPSTTCTPSTSYYGAASGSRYDLQGACTQGTTERYETVRVQHTGTRHVTARELTTRAAAEFTVRRGAIAVTLRFAPPAMSVAEVAYQTPQETRAFSARSVETERVEMRAALARWLGGEFRTAFLEAEARALADAARRAPDDASAEEPYALSVAMAPRDLDGQAIAYFSRTYGVTRDALVAATR